MKDFVEIISEALPVERLHQLRRALETLRDCAKEAMAITREQGQTRSSVLCRGAYRATCRQLNTIERVLRTREGD